MTDDEDRLLEARDICLAAALGTAAWLAMLYGVLWVVEVFL